MKNIIKVVLLMLCIPYVSSAGGFCDKDKYSIVYVNGMLNTESDSENGRFILEKKLRLNGIIKVGERDVVVRKVYNPSHLGGVGDAVKVLIQKGFDISKNIAGLDFDSEKMLQDLHDEVKEGRILFVPHSQGNFYANTMYKWIAAQKGGLSYESMNMYNVASPTQFNAKNSKYLLSKTDNVIAGLVGSVGNIAPPNIEFSIPKNHVDQLGHNFIDTYLALGGSRMASDIKSELEILKADEDKLRNDYCIPSPKTGIVHQLTGAAYMVADPVATAIVVPFMGLIKESANSYTKIASVFSSLNKVIAKNDVSTKTVDVIDTKNTNFTTSDIEYEIWPKAETLKPIESTIKLSSDVGSVVSNILPSEEILKIKDQVNYLKQQIENQTPQKITMGGIGSSGGSHTQFTPIDDVKVEAVSTSTQPAPQVSTSTEQISSTTTLNNISTSTTPLLILGIDIIPHGAVREIVATSTPIEPTIGSLMISEYYIGKENEATWVEIYNTSKTKWIDTKNVIFADNNAKVQFPITAIAPFTSVILRSDGAIIHNATSTNLIVANSLEKENRDIGVFKLLYKDENKDFTLDIAPYGGDFCKNKYSYSRSCERMVSLFPGDKEEYWVRSRRLVEKYKEDTAGDPKYWTSLGAENLSWNFFIYEGNIIKDKYTSEFIKRGYWHYGYVSGQILIPEGSTRTLNRTESWWIIRTESSIFDDNNGTRLDVFGKLRTTEAASIDYLEFGDISMNIYAPGIVIVDPHSSIMVPTKILGGIVRTSYSTGPTTLVSGKLYLTYYDEFSPSKINSCNYFKQNFSFVWRGGSIYIKGYSCGERNEIIDDDYKGEFDLFGVMDKRDPKDCPYYSNNYYELVCGIDPNPYTPPPFIIDTPSPYVPPPATTTTNGDLTHTTSTASTTPIVITPPNNSGSNASSTIPGGGSSATSTSSTTPSSPPAGNASSTTQTGPNSSSTPAIVVPPGGPSATSTASTTPPAPPMPPMPPFPPVNNYASTTNSNQGSSSTVIIIPNTNASSSASSTQTTPSSSSTPPIVIGPGVNASSTSGGGGVVLGTSTSTLDTNGLTIDGCYNGLLSNATNEMQRSATCGNGWGVRPVKLLNDVGIVLRPSRESRLQITEYYIAKSEGEASWVKFSNMTNNAQLYMNNTDFVINGFRIPFPYMEIPKRQFVILKSEGTLNVPFPETSNGNGIITTLYKYKTSLPIDMAKEGNFKMLFAWGIFDPTETIENVEYSATSCPGTITPTGSCSLNKPYMVWNDKSDGWIN